MYPPKLTKVDFNDRNVCTTFQIKQSELSSFYCYFRKRIDKRTRYQSILIRQLQIKYGGAKNFDLKNLCTNRMELNIRIRRDIPCVKRCYKND